MAWDTGYIMAVPIALRATYNALGKALGMPSEAETDTFSAPASPDGREPITHYLACFRATPERKAAIIARRSQADTDGVLFARFDEEERVEESNVGLPLGQAASVEDFLQAAALLPVVSERTRPEGA